MKAEDLYKGRQPRGTARKEGSQVLRAPSKQPGEKQLRAAPSGNYDVSDNYLRGRASPYSPAHYAVKKK